MDPISRYTPSKMWDTPHEAATPIMKTTLGRNVKPDVQSISLPTPELVWEGIEYPHVPAGIYEAVVVEWQGPEWVRHFTRWSLRVGFELLSESLTVSAFYNLGQNRQKLHVGRRSKFFRDWVMANGEQPRRGQKMTLDVFREGQVFTVSVDDFVSQVDGALYSKVTKMLRVAHPLKGAISKSSNHLIRNPLINQSPNHQIKLGILPSPQQKRGKVSPEPGDGTTDRTLNQKWAGSNSRP